jgi:hypothetical protein
MAALKWNKPRLVFSKKKQTTKEKDVEVGREFYDRKMTENALTL